MTLPALHSGDVTVSAVLQPRLQWHEQDLQRSRTVPNIILSSPPLLNLTLTLVWLPQINSFLRADEELCRAAAGGSLADRESGSTALVALVSGAHLLVANAGDSRWPSSPGHGSCQIKRALNRDNRDGPSPKSVPSAVRSCADETKGDDFDAALWCLLAEHEQCSILQWDRVTGTEASYADVVGCAVPQVTYLAAGRSDFAHLPPGACPQGGAVPARPGGAAESGPQAVDAVRERAPGRGWGRRLAGRSVGRCALRNLLLRQDRQWPPGCHPECSMDSTTGLACSYAALLRMRPLCGLHRMQHYIGHHLSPSVCRDSSTPPGQLLKFESEIVKPG